MMCKKFGGYVHRPRNHVLIPKDETSSEISNIWVQQPATQNIQDYHDGDGRADNEQLDVTVWDGGGDSAAGQEPGSEH